ncbi:MAG: hypothetical protein J5965_10040 [Aeriscardovia sp.]|nr:hypothetical protein [Aeriscardovia sp.]
MPINCIRDGVEFVTHSLNSAAISLGLDCSLKFTNGRVDAGNILLILANSISQRSDGTTISLIRKSLTHLRNGLSVSIDCITNLIKSRNVYLVENIILGIRHTSLETGCLGSECTSVSLELGNITVKCSYLTLSGSDSLKGIGYIRVLDELPTITITTLCEAIVVAILLGLRIHNKIYVTDMSVANGCRGPRRRRSVIESGDSCTGPSLNCSINLSLHG